MQKSSSLHVILLGARMQQFKKYMYCDIDNNPIKISKIGENIDYLNNLFQDNYVSRFNKPFSDDL